MPSLNLLTVFNPSNYWRSGICTIPWQAMSSTGYANAQQFAITPDELILSDLRD
ncbi:hypothetical protein H6G41_16370 [Tolypothrix sp. FACHB-123]|uniref:hypothetical protein n=1 Tax=Tolypothrix sp. FACHB-123 TaxID=2692868 RepID=UPI001683412D|nr:hypothetical protein [Tolypothrix sp. FACHB-123]MBD2356181.1 hypothetical protein [Tolypothrix sp. FACHB-123]